MTMSSQANVGDSPSASQALVTNEQLLPILDDLINDLQAQQKSFSDEFLFFCDEFRSETVQKFLAFPCSIGMLVSKLQFVRRNSAKYSQDRFQDVIVSGRRCLKISQIIQATIDQFIEDRKNHLPDVLKENFVAADRNN